WRCNQYTFGSNIHVYVPIWRQGRGHCSCYITVRTAIVFSDAYHCFLPGKMEGTLYPKLYNSYILSFLIVYGGTFCRYFIAFILLWRLRLRVDLLPPGLKHLQFGRFIKNGNLFLIQLTPTRMYRSYF